MDVQFCLEALNEAFACYGTSEIFNTDQGSQYTSNEHIEALDNKGIKISMDGKGRATDNAFVERLWRTIKYEDIFIRDYSSVMELKAGVKRFFNTITRKEFISRLNTRRRMRYITIAKRHQVLHNNLRGCTNNV